MASGSRLQVLAPYLERAALNEYVQERLTEAVESLRGAYARASRQSAAKAAQDRQLHRRLGRAVIAARDAAVAVGTGRQPKRRTRKPAVLLGAVAIGAAAIAAGPLRRKLSAEQPSEPDLADRDQAAAPQPQPSTA